MKLKAVTTWAAIVGCVLVRLRERRSVNQPDLARAVGVAQSTWSRIECGTSGMSIEQLMLAATALHVTPAAVLQKASTLRTHLLLQGIQVEPCRSWVKPQGGLLLSPDQLQRFAHACNC